MKNLRNKTAIVTGGSKGIGLRIARALAGEGVHQVIVARNKEQIVAAAKEIEL